MSKKYLAAIAFLAMAVLSVSYGVLAEETEELQTDDNGTADEKPVTFMFVQNAQSGTLIPVEGVDNLYTLTLMGVSPQTLAFSDRPERVVVQAPMQKFLDGMCFGPENPPNAAIEILDADEEEDLAVVELFDPVYDAASQTLQYNVSILETPGLSYAVFNERADQSLPETFGPAALFIDDCHDSKTDCENLDGTVCGTVDMGCCWSWSVYTCEQCHDASDECKNKYGSTCGYYTSHCGW